MSDEALAPGDLGHAPLGSEPEPPPRGVRTMAIVRWAIVVLSAALAVVSWWSFAHGESAGTGAKYYCPMHPQIVTDAPGECPICHMKLEPIPESRRRSAATPTPQPARAAPKPAAPKPAQTAAKDTVYTCPMHPQVQSKTPGRCPICGMYLQKREPTAGAPQGAAGTAGEAAPPSDVVPITLALDRVQAIGVRTSPVKPTRANGTLRVTATVETPERQRSEVHVRTPGFVERISVRDSGATVKAGQELLAVYSPELYSAQSELLVASRWGDDPNANTAREQGKKKLELLGMSRAAIEQVIQSGNPVRAVGVHAEISGTVIKKNAVLGSYVTPDMVLYEIVDLTKVYVVADVYQSDLPNIGPGTIGRFSVPTRPGYAADVTIELIYPNVAVEARTTRVRMIVNNKSSGLLPGQYGYVDFELSNAGASAGVLVPRDALIDTGLHAYVFVAHGEGHFEPRAVTVLAERGDEIEVRGALEPSERVVSGATFLIDSESRLSASLAQHDREQESAPSHAGHAP